MCVYGHPTDPIFQPPTLTFFIGNYSFSKFFNVEETKGIIHSQIIPARDVTLSVSYIISALITCNFIIKNYVNRKITTGRYNLRMDYAFCLLHIEEFWKWWSPLFGATGNFNNQILPYGILFLTFINTNVFYLLSVKFSR
jgi:hypothetical protein